MRTCDKYKVCPLEELWGGWEVLGKRTTGYEGEGSNIQKIMIGNKLEECLGLNANSNFILKTTL